MNPVITISREYGSGGREIGRRLSEELGIPFYDKRLIVLASQESGIHPDYFEQADEQSINTFFYSIPAMEMGVGFSDLSMHDKVFLADTNIIRDIAAKEPCVIVGRCADFILKDDPSVLNFFICADLKSRARRAVEEYAILPEKAEKYIEKVDRKRANYYRHYTSEKWGDSHNFHLTIRSDLLGLPQTVELIKDYIKIKN